MKLASCTLSTLSLQFISYIINMPNRYRSNSLSAWSAFESNSTQSEVTSFQSSSCTMTWSHIPLFYSQLQTWFSTKFVARFSTSSCGFVTCFRLFLSKTWSRHVEIDAAGSQQVRWLVRVLDNWNVETRGQSNLTKSASRGAHSPVRGHHRGSKFVPLNSWGRVSY